MIVVPTAIGVEFLARRPRWRARLSPWAFGLAAAVALATAGLTLMTAHSVSKSVYREVGEIMTGETGNPGTPASGQKTPEPSDG